MSHLTENDPKADKIGIAVQSDPRGSSTSRSNIACGSCRLRKVRCSFSATGKPCTNCQYDGVDCEIVPRRRNGSVFPPDAGVPRSNRTSAKRKHFWGRTSRQDLVDEEMRPHEETLSTEGRLLSVETTGPFHGKDPASPWQSQSQDLLETSSPNLESSRGQSGPDLSNDFSIAFDSHISPHPGSNRGLLYFGTSRKLPDGEHSLTGSRRSAGNKWNAC